MTRLLCRISDVELQSRELLSLVPFRWAVKPPKSNRLECKGDKTLLTGPTVDGAEGILFLAEKWDVI